MIGPASGIYLLFGPTGTDTVQCFDVRHQSRTANAATMRTPRTDTPRISSSPAPGRTSSVTAAVGLLWAESPNHVTGTRRSAMLIAAIADFAKICTRTSSSRVAPFRRRTTIEATANSAKSARKRKYGTTRLSRVRSRCSTVWFEALSRELRRLPPPRPLRRLRSHRLAPLKRSPLHQR